MSKISLSELLKQDIKDLKGLLNYEKYGLTEELMKTQARAIILNLQDHLTTIAQDDGQDSSSLSEKILNLFFGRVPSE